MTLTKEQSYVGIPALYENIALVLYGKQGNRYDCRKVEVGEEIRENCYQFYKDKGYDIADINMAWLAYGPKASLEGYEFKVEEGWCE